ncbi:ESX-1 secretion-associated protein EspI-like [Cydia fagiglandana]|uniref:ESX-1 secretion-associated protein EspI-like n=1 Tax=Cydia fagiglandana TaxID=1458189 RepID=UPI002FEE4C9B
MALVESLRVVRRPRVTTPRSTSPVGIAHTYPDAKPAPAPPDHAASICGARGSFLRTARRRPTEHVSASATCPRPPRAYDGAQTPQRPRKPPGAPRPRRSTAPPPRRRRLRATPRPLRAHVLKRATPFCAPPSASPRHRGPHRRRPGIAAPIGVAPAARPPRASCSDAISSSAPRPLHAQRAHARTNILRARIGAAPATRRKLSFFSV